MLHEVRVQLLYLLLRYLHLFEARRDLLIAEVAALTSFGNENLELFDLAEWRVGLGRLEDNHVFLCAQTHLSCAHSTPGGRLNEPAERLFLRSAAYAEGAEPVKIRAPYLSARCIEPGATIPPIARIATNPSHYLAERGNDPADPHRPGRSGTSA